MAPPGTDSGPLRVMVVDDSAVMRGVVGRMIGEDPKVAVVVASAANGQLAVERARKNDIEVVILDVEMPVMDGLTALPNLLAIDPHLVVIMASALTTQNADVTLRALAAGAKDYIPKPSSTTPGSGADQFKRELMEKIKTFGDLRRRKPRNAPRPGARLAVAPASVGPRLILRPIQRVRPRALAIGCSTGGPNALPLVVKALRRPLGVPVLITQHMPPKFTELLATNLSRDTGHVCVEAKDGEPVLPGKIYIAPGDFHMTAAVSGAGVVIRLNQNERENFCRPAVDAMLRSLVDVYKHNLLAAILTGMGEDGLVGARVVVEAGGNVVAQDEASSVVWGMPGAVAKGGLCCSVLPLSELGKQLDVMLG